MSLSAEDLSLDQPRVLPIPKDVPSVPIDHRSPYGDEDDDDDEYDEEYEEEEPHHTWLGGSTAARFLLAGGVAGAGKTNPAIDCMSTDLLQYRERVLRHSTG